MSQTAEDEIWSAIQRANRAWSGGNPGGVADLFHPDVIMVAPGLTTRVRGRAAMVRSFVEFCSYARTHEFRELEHAIDVLDGSAVATYRFSVRYEAEGKTCDDVGQEVLVFVPHEGAWKAIWRTQTTISQKIVAG